MDLGKPEISLAVSDLSQSLAFYQAFGFRVCEGEKGEGWLVLELGAFRLGLYEGHIPQNMLTFQGGNVTTLTKELVARGVDLVSGPEREGDGTTGAVLRDPDGNLIYLNT